MVISFVAMNLFFAVRSLRYETEHLHPAGGADCNWNLMRKLSSLGDWDMLLGWLANAGKEIMIKWTFTFDSRNNHLLRAVFIGHRIEYLWWFWGQLNCDSANKFLNYFWQNQSFMWNFSEITKLLVKNLWHIWWIDLAPHQSDLLKPCLSIQFPYRKAHIL